MKRTTVVLTDQQAALLELERRRQGISTAAIVRQALDRYLGGGEEPPELWFIGLGESDGTERAADSEDVLAREWTYRRIMGVEEDRPTTEATDPSTSTGPGEDQSSRQPFAEPVTTSGASAARRAGRHER